MRVGILGQVMAWGRAALPSAAAEGAAAASTNTTCAPGGGSGKEATREVAGGAAGGLGATLQPCASCAPLSASASSWNTDRGRPGCSDCA